MFDMLAWIPLAETENIDTIHEELAAELDKVFGAVETECIVLC